MEIKAVTIIVGTISIGVSATVLVKQHKAIKKLKKEIKKGDVLIGFLNRNNDILLSAMTDDQYKDVEDIMAMELRFAQIAMNNV